MNSQQFRPSLTEPGVKYFLSESLKKCHEQRVEVDYYMLNLGLLGVFVLFITVYLIYKYKTRPTEKDRENSKKLKRDYFVTKVRKMQADKAKELNQNITNLPKFESPFEVLHKKFYHI
tara:strand:+ start:1099 stop:1452 length:354 start_codon:yes stop_codon:yes gene_type:complete